MKKTIKAVMVTVVGFTLSWQTVWGQAKPSPDPSETQPQAAQPVDANIQSSQDATKDMGAIKLLGNTTEQEQYVEKEIIFAKWGINNGEMELMVGDTFDGRDGKKYVDRNGPSRIKISPNENIYIQGIKLGIYIYDKNGIYKTTLKFKETNYFDDFDVDEDENIYTYYCNRKTPQEIKKYGIYSFIKTFDNKGNIKRIYKIEEEKGKVGVPDIFYQDGKLYGINAKTKETSMEVTKNKNSTGRRKDITKKDLSLKSLPEQEGYPIGMDKGKRTFVLVDNWDRNIWPWHKYEMYVYENKGELICIVPMKIDLFLHYSNISHNNFDIDSKGNIYQIWTDKEGAHITRWEIK